MAERAVRSAARRRERWLRSMWRHEQLSVRMAVATATHHSWKSHAVVGTQTEYVAPACTSATVATGVNLDVTGFASPLFSRTAVEGSASQVVGSLPPAEEFSEPVYDQVHRERFAAGETTEKSAEFPVVPEQVIVQAIPRVAGTLPPVDEFTPPVYNPAHQEQFSAGDTSENFANFPDVQEQVLVQAIPRFVGTLPPLDEVRPSVRAQRHGELAPSVQFLDLPVPQMEDQFVDNLNLVDQMEALRLLDRPIAEHVIAVPMVSCSSCPSRSRVPEPQSADQLVDVPTVLFPRASLFRSLSRSLTLWFLMVVLAVPSQSRAQQLVVLS